MGWFYLILAGLFEIGFTTSLKLSQNFTLAGPSFAFVACAILSFALLTRAVKTLPLGTAYAVWTGIGAVGTAVVGIVAFAEPATIARTVLLGLLVACLVGLKLAGDRRPADEPVA